MKQTPSGMAVDWRNEEVDLESAENLGEATILVPNDKGREPTKLGAAVFNGGSSATCAPQGVAAWTGPRFNEMRVPFSFEVNARKRRITDGRDLPPFSARRAGRERVRKYAVGARRWRLIWCFPLDLVTDAVLIVESKNVRERLSIDVTASLCDWVVHYHLTKWLKRRWLDKMKER